jgi:hypothetical protein
VFITNHIAAGTLIALNVASLPVAIGLSFASHLALDALPHWGMKVDDHVLRGKIIVRYGSIDAVLALIMMSAMLLTGLSLELLAVGLVSVIPDAIWVSRFVFEEKLGKYAPGPKGPFSRFHSWIQWGERPWGFVTEIPFFLVSYWIILTSL